MTFFLDWAKFKQIYVSIIYISSDSHHHPFYCHARPDALSAPLLHAPIYIYIHFTIISASTHTTFNCYHMLTHIYTCMDGKMPIAIHSLCDSHTASFAIVTMQRKVTSLSLVRKGDGTILIMDAIDSYNAPMCNSSSSTYIQNSDICRLCTIAGRTISLLSLEQRHVVVDDLLCQKVCLNRVMHLGNTIRSVFIDFIWILLPTSWS